MRDGSEDDDGPSAQAAVPENELAGRNVRQVLLQQIAEEPSFPDAPQPELEPEFVAQEPEDLTAAYLRAVLREGGPQEPGPQPGGAPTPQRVDSRQAMAKPLAAKSKAAPAFRRMPETAREQKMYFQGRVAEMRCTHCGHERHNSRHTLQGSNQYMLRAKCGACGTLMITERVRGV